MAHTRVRIQNKNNTTPGLPHHSSNLRVSFSMMTLFVIALALFGTAHAFSAERYAANFTSIYGSAGTIAVDYRTFLRSLIGKKTTCSIFFFCFVKARMATLRTAALARSFGPMASRHRARSGRRIRFSATRHFNCKRQTLVHATVCS